MADWWQGLSTQLQIFYGIGIATGALLLIQLLLLVIGLDGASEAGDFDLDGPQDHPGGLQLISVRTVAAFFTGLGWGGVVGLEAGWGLAAALVLGIVVGGNLTAAVFYLMKFLFSLQTSGSLDYHNAIGESGQVYVTVPCKMGGAGQVQVKIQGRLKMIDAMTRSEADLPGRSMVRVVDTVDERRLLVEPLED